MDGTRKMFLYMPRSEGFGFLAIRLKGCSFDSADEFMQKTVVDLMRR